MASDKEKDRSLDGRDTGQRSRGPSDTNSVGSRSDKNVDRSLGGGGGGGLNRGGMMGNRESQAASRESSYSGRGGMNSPGEGARSSGSSVGGREVGDVGGMARDVGQVGNGLRGGTAMERATDLASARRASENASMDTYSRMRTADFATAHRATEDASMSGYYGALENALSTIRTAEAGITNPYDRLVGGQKTPNYADVTGMTINEALDYAKGMKARGHLANVLGGLQFKDTTLRSIATRMGFDADTTKMTPEVQDKLAVGLMQSRAANATVDGKIDVDAFAKELAKEWASLATASGQSFYSGNKIDKASVSYSKVRDMAQSLVDTGVVSPRQDLTAIAASPRATSVTRLARGDETKPTVPDTPSLPEMASIPTPRATAFETKYLGATPADRVAMEYSNATTARNAAPAQPVQHTAAQARAEFEQDQRVASAYESTPGPQAATPAPQVATAETAPTVQTATRVDAVPSTTVQPANAAETVKPTLASATTEEEAPKQRTTGQQVAATGVDIGLGLVPGIGMGLSLVNGALTLTGNRTLGERLIDAIGTGDGTGFNPAERDPSRREQRERKEKATTTVIAANPKRFEQTYLAFIDTTKRPTPAEKWGTGTANYGDREYG